MSLLLEHLDIIMFGVLIGGILAGYPVTFTLAGLAMIFAGIGIATGHFDSRLLGALAQRIFGIMTNNVLIAIPLFVAMGVVLERSRIAEDLLEEMGRLFGQLRGGLAVSVTLVGALLAASTGIVGATVTTMALIALPSMLRYGYSRPLAAGTVCTAGTLGQIIPPSTMLIILADVMSTAFQQAQYEQGLFSVQTLSVGQVFSAALVPGLVLVGLYIAYILAISWMRPGIAPPVQDVGGNISIARVMKVLVPPIALIVAVLGSILGGFATPTEAASVGAVGALMLAALRVAPGQRRWPVLIGLAALLVLVAIAGTMNIRPQRSDAMAMDLALAAGAVGLMLITASSILVSIKRAHSSGILGGVVRQTMVISAMIFGTIIGASIFSLIFRGLGGDATIEAILTGMPGGETGALIFVMMMVFVLGFVLDFVEITIILLPIVVPALILLGHDPMWLSILIAINLQTSFLTPPFGFSLFYLRGAAPKEVSTGAIYRGVIPFIGLQIIGITLVWLFPEIATTLPKLLFG